MITVREAIESDAECILRVHVDSIRGLCKAHYPVSQIEEWSGGKTPKRFREGMTSGEAFVVAEDGLQIVGFGVLDPKQAEIRAVFIDPGNTRRGAGRLILRELERIASRLGMSQVCLKSTLNAVGFYRREGYTGEQPGIHKLKSGAEMACVAMVKVLDS